jgi:hypothetical protein
MTLLALLAALPWPGAAHAGAGPAPGWIEEWPGTSLQAWTGGAAHVNLGTGGVGGAGDGFLLISTATAGRLGTYSDAAEYTGDWIAAGVRSVKLWLNDVGAEDPVEIHVGIGVSNLNFWQYDVGFRPPHGAWQQFVVDLGDSTRFTQLFGTASFSAALQTANKIHFRHDLAPFPPEPNQEPDLIAADVGIDRLELSSTTVPARPTTWSRLKALYRGSAADDQRGRRLPSTR